MISILVMLAAASGAAPPDAPASPAAAVQGSVSGRTAANPKVAAEALQELSGFAGRALKCSAVQGAKATVMPKGWLPTDRNFRIGPAGAVYERWEVRLCGRVEPFVVAFWQDRKLGMQYQVGHPFPAGKVVKSRR
jgi:hypothetical protein